MLPSRHTSDRLQLKGNSCLPLQCLCYWGRHRMILVPSQHCMTNFAVTAKQSDRYCRWGVVLTMLRRDSTATFFNGCCITWPCTSATKQQQSQMSGGRSGSTFTPWFLRYMRKGPAGSMHQLSMHAQSIKMIQLACQHKLKQAMVSSSHTCEVLSGAELVLSLPYLRPTVRSLQPLRLMLATSSGARPTCFMMTCRNGAQSMAR